MSILCLWEIIERDSAAEVVLGLFYFIIMTFALLWAAFKVVRIAQRSVSLHKNPAYILYSDPKALNKWGFLYVQFRATAYYFILPVLGYICAKAIFIAFAQGAPKVQAVGLLIIEAGFLVTVSILKPWMDRKTNIFNISIAAVNFLNAVFLLVFTNIFNQPVSSLPVPHPSLSFSSKPQSDPPPTGHCHRRHGCRLFCLQRCLRFRPPPHGLLRQHLRHRQQEPRHALPAHAR